MGKLLPHGQPINATLNPAAIYNSWPIPLVLLIRPPLSKPFSSRSTLDFLLTRLVFLSVDILPVPILPHSFVALVVAIFPLQRRSISACVAGHFPVKVVELTAVRCAPRAGRIIPYVSRVHSPGVAHPLALLKNLSTQ